MLVCGPSFGSGRYGYACGVLAREAGRRGMPVVAAMTPDSPGVLAAEGAAYVVPTGSNVAGMREALPIVASLAARLASGEPVGGPEDEGYLPRGLRLNALVERTGAERAIDLLLAKLAGDVRTEIAPSGDRVAPAPPVEDLASVRLALVTEAGCVPQGNPDRLPTRHANVWLRYRLDGAGSLAAGRLRVGACRVRHHGGERGPEPARAARRRARARARGVGRHPARRVLHHDRRGHAGRGGGALRAGDRGGAAGGAGRGGDPDRHLRHRHALRGNAGEGDRAEGIPTVFVTALPTIAQMVGANRILRGVSITNPTGDPSLAPGDERAMRIALVRRALGMLATDVEPRTVWEATP